MKRQFFVAVVLASCGVLALAAPPTVYEAMMASIRQSTVPELAALELHPLVKAILDTPELGAAGSVFIPTPAAWDDWHATLLARSGNFSSPQVQNRMGQILMAHIVDGQTIPFDAAGLTASVNLSPRHPWLCNSNGVLVATAYAVATPADATLTFGQGNAQTATIDNPLTPLTLSSAKGYSVNKVLLPCDEGALLAEAYNKPVAPECVVSMEEGLVNANLTYFLQLALATGLDIFPNLQNFTLFVPSNLAFETAIKQGQLNVGAMYATQAGFEKLFNLVNYYIINDVSQTGPGPAINSSRTTLPVCAPLAWTEAAKVEGGNGKASVVATPAAACKASLVVLDKVLTPCCQSLADTIGGLKATSPSPSTTAVYNFIAAIVDMAHGANMTFFLPTPAALNAYVANFTAADSSKLIGLMSYFYTTGLVDTVSTSPFATALTAGAAATLCPAGTTPNVNLRFSSLAPTPTARRLLQTATSSALYVIDGRGKSALVINSLTSCDGQIFFTDNVLLPCDPTAATTTTTTTTTVSTVTTGTTATVNTTTNTTTAKSGAGAAKFGGALAGAVLLLAALL